MAEITEQEDERMTGQPHIRPKIDEIVKLLAQNGPLHKGEEAGQAANASLAKVYQKIEKDFHGNKAAVKCIRQLVKMSDDKAFDFMRTFEPLADYFHLYPNDDLAGEGSPRSGGGGDGPSGGGGQPIETPEGGDFEATPEELAKQEVRPQSDKPADGVTDEMIAKQKAAAEKPAKSNVSPIESAKARMQGGTKPKLGLNHPKDDSDLAGVPEGTTTNGLGQTG